MDKELKKDLIKYTAILIIIVVLYFLILRGLQSKKNKEIKEASKTIEELTQGINSKKLTYNAQAYKNYANALYLAMKGAGTDEDTILRVLKFMQNTDDMKQLAKDFGVREAMNLNQWIRDEFSSFVLPFQTSINDLNKLLASKKINYQF